MRIVFAIIQIYVIGFVLSVLYFFAFEAVPFGEALEISLVWPRVVYEAIVGP